MRQCSFHCAGYRIWTCSRIYLTCGYDCCARIFYRNAVFQHAYIRITSWQCAVRSTIGSHWHRLVVFVFCHDDVSCFESGNVGCDIINIQRTTARNVGKRLDDYDTVKPTLNFVNITIEICCCHFVVGLDEMKKLNEFAYNSVRLGFAGFF